jgi:hypothetical protein
MDPDRELLTVVTHLVNAYCPTLPMLYVLGIACAEYLTCSGPPPAVEVAARRILDRAAAEARSGPGMTTSLRPRPSRPRLVHCPTGQPAPLVPRHQHVRQCRALVAAAGRTPRCGRSHQ